jgi:hypothetical protein
MRGYNGFKRIMLLCWILDHQAEVICYSRMSFQLIGKLDRVVIFFLE